MILQGTWESALLSNSFGLYNGGTAGVIWMTIAVWVLVMTSIASIAEMASIAPTAGGQYHWVSEFAPDSIQQPLSYIVGWMCCLGWVAAIPACGQFFAAVVNGMILLANLNASDGALWQATLLAIAFIVITVAFNLFCAKWLPMVETMLLVLHTVSFFVFLIVLWVSSKHAPAKQVFTEFHDGGGWGNIGLSTLVGIGGPLWTFVGPDSAAHMSEELQDASYQLPRAMMWATLFNGITGIAMLITFWYVSCHSIIACDTQSLTRQQLLHPLHRRRPRQHDRHPRPRGRAQRHRLLRRGLGPRYPTSCPHVLRHRNNDSSCLASMLGLRPRWRLSVLQLDPPRAPALGHTSERSALLPGLQFGAELHQFRL